MNLKALSWPVLLLGILVITGCNAKMSKGMQLEKMKTSFEEFGQTVARAEHCRIKTERVPYEEQLRSYVRQNEIERAEEDSLVSYYHTAIQLESQTLRGRSCENASEIEGQLKEKLDQFK